MASLCYPKNGVEPLNQEALSHPEVVELEDQDPRLPTPVDQDPNPTRIPSPDPEDHNEPLTTTPVEVDPESGTPSSIDSNLEMKEPLARPHTLFVNRPRTLFDRPIDVIRTRLTLVARLQASSQEEDVFRESPACSHSISSGADLDVQGISESVSESTTESTTSTLSTSLEELCNIPHCQHGAETLAMGPLTSSVLAQMAAYPAPEAVHEDEGRTMSRFARLLAVPTDPRAPTPPPPAVNLDHFPAPVPVQPISSSVPGLTARIVGAIVGSAASVVEKVKGMTISEQDTPSTSSGTSTD